MYVVIFIIIPHCRDSVNCFESKSRRVFEVKLFFS
nr:MAG TPA_asm: hypothetical protein [Inoviridae sp.]